MFSTEEILIRGILKDGRAPSGAPEGLDWSRFEALAHGHGVAGLLHVLTGQGGGEALPGLVKEGLRQAYYGSTVRALLAARAVKEIDAALMDAPFGLCLIQGSALPAGLYKRPGMRPSCDIDLLVEAGRLRDLDALLTGAGFLRASLAPLLYAGRGVVLDVHTEPVEFSRFGGVAPPMMKAGDVLSHGRPHTTGGALLVPADDDLFILACAHLMKHSFMRLIWFCDLRLLMSRDGFNWGSVCRRAEGCGLASPLSLCMELLPAYLGGSTQPMTGAKGLGFVERRALAGLKRHGPSPGMGDLLYVAGIKGLLNRAAYVRDIMSPPGRDGCRPGNTGDEAKGRGLGLGRGIPRVVKNIRLGAFAAYGLLNFRR